MNMWRQIGMACIGYVLGWIIVNIMLIIADWPVRFGWFPI